ncbi:MAG: hypothetical protein IJ593_02395 [Lachnospiraceae bacterium]|nr:hypothetical protein [Lachnospiraceae bacterium]
MKYSKEFRDKVCQEYLTTDIGRKEIYEKYNLPLNTIKCWLFRYYPDEYKVDKKARSYKQTNVTLKNTNKVSSKEMTKEQLQAELIKKDFEIARLKKSIHGYAIRKTQNQMVIINKRDGEYYSSFLLKK